MEQGKQSDHRSNGSNALGNLILTKRTAAGLTRSQLAKETGVSRPYISRLERGDYANPSSRVLGRIIKRLGISADDALLLTGYMTPTELSAFGRDVREKHADWPEGALQELERFYDFLKYKYSLK